MPRRIVADYQRPQALIVAHYHSTILPLLESIATRAARHVGVVLLSRDPELTRAFVESQSQRAHFHIVTAEFDTPWLRDRAPIAIKTQGAIVWVLPKLDSDDRPLDEALFERISGRPIEHFLRGLPQGNLVAGPNGRAVVLRKDSDDGTQLHAALQRIGPVLGVREWIVAPSFASEVTGHADVHIRFLSRKLAAVAWSMDEVEDRERAQELIGATRNALPAIDIVKLPMRSCGAAYASPLNWLQFGRHVIVPRYDLTTAQDIVEIRGCLHGAGYKTDFVYSPTLEFAGSLHCLTGSLYIGG